MYRGFIKIDIFFCKVMITKIFSTVATFKTILKLSEREVVLYANNCSK